MNFHKTKDGQLIPFNSMTDNHLKATVNLLLNRPFRSGVHFEGKIQIMSRYIIELELRGYPQKQFYDRINEIRESFKLSFATDIALYLSSKINDHEDDYDRVGEDSGHPFWFED